MTDSIAPVAEQPHSTAKYSARIAGDGDSQLLAEILADAFQDDPVVRWVIPDSKYDQKFFTVDLVQAYLPHKHCWVLGDGQGASCWLPPAADVKSAPLLPLLSVFVPIIFKHGFQCVKRGGVIERVFAEHRPTQAHYYLHMLGARHGQQGKGIGSALLREGLQVVDQHAMPAYLESSNESNVPLYERFGFEITSEQTLGDDGPKVWFMWRPAQSG
ncbi:MAG: GNAT family N-acetyltransferase [Pseudomonadales bacterium]